ncbi:3-hydroxyacyl-CoA dehydrogenase family protein [Gorillibacterium timonense]|uniref:3-hydroxyacyl-CoA dehydrogenase family protein n=1 Tax=Gorillibacterium timonense TaxID=1689269 RepID=UPI00071D0EF3|nr:3-hydroxyacyl-CoA dehydrogenase NAD-binding domain-containing protein [Gorillibacterium timonense]
MKFSKIGLIGVGTVGQGIAEMLAKSGLDVYMLEHTNEKLETAITAISNGLDKQIEKWGITNSEKKLILGHLRKAESVESLNSCQLVIESTTEDIDNKKAIISKLDEVCAPDVIIASTTSTLSLSELATACTHPERVIGMHFLIPMTEIDVVEVVRGIRTSDETINAARIFLEETLHKKGIQVQESPGLVTTRLICTLINEAIAVLAEGIATAEDIDASMRDGYDLKYGPLEMCDRFGLDSTHAALSRMFKEYGELKYRPNYLLKKMVRAGQLGLKTGEGFFRYNKDGVRV